MDHRNLITMKYLVFALIVFSIVTSLSGAAESDRPVKRARPPKWPEEVRRVFFDDAREKLVGTRPTYDAEQVAGSVKAESTPKIAAESGDATWSTLIDAEAIETEVKRLAEAVANDVTTPSEFKGGAFKECRRDFSTLAMFFAIAAQYDGYVRWKDAAPALRDAFARAGANCKVGTDQTFQEATQRKQDLADLIRGSRPEATRAERTTDWSQIADRSPLMERLNIAHQDRLMRWLANERQFEQHRDDIRHEAQVVAAIADVIAREGYDYWDDDQYAAYARELRQAAIDATAAAEHDNYDQARQAIDRATKACADCHDGYRE